MTEFSRDATRKFCGTFPSNVFSRRAACVHGPCISHGVSRRAVYMGCVHGLCIHGLCTWAVYMGCVHGLCTWAVNIFSSTRSVKINYMAVARVLKRGVRFRGGGVVDEVPSIRGGGSW